MKAGDWAFVVEGADRRLVQVTRVTSTGLLVVESFRFRNGRDIRQTHVQLVAASRAEVDAFIGELRKRAILRDLEKYLPRMNRDETDVLEELIDAVQTRLEGPVEP